MSCSSVLFSLFLMSPCGADGSGEVNKAVAAAVSNSQRPAEDIAKDARRKPAQVLSFFDIEPGMTVLDLFSGGGYYTELLNSLVGKNGKVIAHTNQAYIPFSGKVYQTRYIEDRLAQSETVITEIDDIQLQENSLDAVMMVLVWHDFLYADPKSGWLAIDEISFLDKLCRAMKPGAILGFIDHAANSGGNAEIVAEKLHRVDPQLVRDTFADSCFSLKGEAGFLGNQQDDHSLSVFDKSINGNSDRFVFKFVRN